MSSVPDDCFVAADSFEGSLPGSGKLNIQDNYFSLDGPLNSHVSAHGNASQGHNVLSRELSATTRAKYLEYRNTQNLNTNNLLIDHILQNREKEFVSYENLNVFIGTYNVNGQEATCSLKDWLGVGSVVPDIYAIGFQELDLTQSAYIGTSTKDDEWATVVANGLHSGATYREIKRVRLVGMFLLLYVRIELVSKVHSLHSACVGTGLLGRIGNKGGVAISMKIHDMWLCFVNSHLAAHFGELDRRNQDFREVCRLRFNAGASPTDARGVFDHDLVLWLGDLNYRLAELEDGRSLDYSFVTQTCKNREFSTLLIFDQLKHVQMRGEAFVGFSEAPITFMPTYKYDPNSSDFDTSEKCRVPAWCDRFLWYGESRYLRVDKYESVPSILISDHKPVYACGRIKARVIDKLKYQKVFKEAIKEVDRLENEYLPLVELDCLEFDFGTVKFHEPKIQLLSVRNTGQIDVEFRFKPKPPQNTPYKCWLNVTPDHQIIPKGETLVIELQIIIDKTAAWSLNTLEDTVDDILIFHLDHGKDFFVTITGKYSPSCFGRPIDYLVEHSRFAREKIQNCQAASSGSGDPPTGQLIDLGGSESKPGLAYPVNLDPDLPVELQLMVTHIEQQGLSVPNLFSEPGRQADFEDIRDALDSGELDKCVPLPGSIHSVIETLCRFLDSFPEPVIPCKYSPKALNAAAGNNYPAAVALIDELPFYHGKVFKYFVKLLRDILARKSANGTDIASLAVSFGPVILKPEANSKQNTGKVQQLRVKFLAMFLETPPPT